MGLAAKVGIVAVQGDIREHIQAVADLGGHPVEVRRGGDLAGVDALILPGGESTAMSLLLDSAELFEPLAELVARGVPVLGTCAGMILLAREVLDGRAGQRSLGAIDIAVRRNAFGRQVNSFETDLDVSGLEGGRFAAVFIRAPVVEDAGPGVEVLAEIDDRPVLCRQGAITVAAFHPELTGDLRIHERSLGGW